MLKKNILMVQDIKVQNVMVLDMEKENLLIMIVVIMMDNGKIIKWMEKEHFIIVKEKSFMMVNG